MVSSLSPSPPPVHTCPAFGEHYNGVIPHWVLIVGKDESEYLMRDPLGDGETLGRVSRYNSKIYAIRTLKNGESPGQPVR